MSGREWVSLLLPCPEGPQSPADSLWFGFAYLGTNTCFPCQPRTAGIRGSGPRPRAAAAAAPKTLMASAEHVRRPRGSGSAQLPAPRHEPSKSRRQSAPEEHFRGERCGGGKRRKKEEKLPDLRAEQHPPLPRRPLATRKRNCSRFVALNQAFASSQKDAAFKRGFFFFFADITMWRNVYNRI